MERRLITPAEAALLLAPAPATAAKCLQAGLLSLLDAGRIDLAATANPFAKSVLVLVSPISGAELPAHIEALARALALNSRGTRLSAAEVLHALQRGFGVSYRRYVTEQVGPSLIKRGLLQRIDDKWLGLFPRIRYVRTAAGEALAAPLERLMRDIDQLPSLIERDPDQALRLARSAGVLLIMAPKARRQIPALRKLLAARGDDSGFVAYTAIGPGDEDGDDKFEQLLDIGDMALEFDIPALFDSIDAVGDLTSGSDGSSSDGGGDGGGGGGD